MYFITVEKPYILLLSVSDDSRFPIPDSRFPSSNRKPQLGATLCSKLYRWGFSEGIKFVKKVSRRERGQCHQWRAR
ncbi:MAG: hypothetical protein F6K26_46125 [Moorea sp. SIO2I5]|nr:hypothetical protein [Moorena sp. SIO2I5]